MSSGDRSSSGEPASIEFRSVVYSLGQQVLLSNVTFTVAPGETLVLLGRSGAGKTTALKLINALLTPTYGDIFVQGRSTSAWDPILLRRSTGWVIQETGLFPHFSVAKNIGAVPRLLDWTEQRIKARVEEVMNLVGLELELSTRYPHQLSGGQRQRVGVARALAADPKILLMDEPFGALDPITRSELQHQFFELQRRLRKTVVMVTHDLREALMLGSRIALLDSGELTGLFSTHEFLTSSNPAVRQYIEAFGDTKMPA
jgi:osmoprotectant transport system ATP-binding protein